MNARLKFESFKYIRLQSNDKVFLKVFGIYPIFSGKVSWGK